MDEIVYYNNTFWFYKRYLELIDKALKRGLDKSKLDYITEKHHILPRCMGGKDEDNNYVLLTCKEHYIAHLILYRIYPEIPGLTSSLFLMSSRASKNDLNFKISSRIYSQIREDFIKTQKEKTLTEDHKKKIGDSNRDPSEETRKRMSESQKKRTDLKEIGRRNGKLGKGKTLSEESINKRTSTRLDKPFNDSWVENISKAKKGIPLGPPTDQHRNNISNAKKGKRSRTKVVDSDGRVFETLKECGEFHGKSPGMIKYYITKRKDLGFRRYEDPPIGDNSNRKVQGPDNTIYKSIEECSQITGYSKNAINKWIINNPEKGFKYI